MNTEKLKKLTLKQQITFHRVAQEYASSFLKSRQEKTEIREAIETIKTRREKLVDDLLKDIESKEYDLDKIEFNKSIALDMQDLFFIMGSFNIIAGAAKEINGLEKRINKLN